MSNRWLYEQLRRVAPDNVDLVHFPLIRGRSGNRVCRIYCPSPAEYMITVDIVQKVIALGPNTISYAESWSCPSFEAKTYATANDVEILPHRALLERFVHGSN
jgi:hypothetical protein